MDSIFVTAAMAGSAIAGGFITYVFGPMVKHHLEERSNENQRRREQIQKWRDMLLQIDGKAETSSDVPLLLQTHPDCITLLPHLTPEGRRAVTGENRTFIVGSALSAPLVVLRDEISRIEGEWKLR